MSYKPLKVNPSRGKLKAGFSLVELSLLITILGIIVASYVSWQNPVDETSKKLIATREKISTIIEAYERYVRLNQRLLCPASPAQPLSSDPKYLTYSYGGNTRLAFDDERLDNTTTTPNLCLITAGAIPTRALGLSSEYQLDGWGRRFVYVVSSQLCGETNPCTAQSYLDKSSQGDLVVQPLGGGSAIVEDAAIVIFSAGPDGVKAYNIAGDRITGEQSADEAENTDFDAYASPSNLVYRNGEFSSEFRHIMAYRTKEQLQLASSISANKVISLDECIDIRKEVKALSRDRKTQTNNTQTELNAVLSDLALMAPNSTGGAAVLELLWLTQDICYQLYAASLIDKSASTPACPGQATYNQIYNRCECANGGFDGDC